ncbi:hypothetical protein KC887_04035 [Candidatus Kaiserbacteria bacterium]|nr:hypothetical protein [Candidatus Kaiserbacteria bacterium]
MAVVPMQKVRLFVHHDEVDAALAVLQRHGAASFFETRIDGMNPATVVFAQHDLLARVQHAVWFLELYEVKRPLLTQLRKGVRFSLSETEAQHQGGDPDVVEAIVSDVEAVQVEFADASEVVRQLQEQHEALVAWKVLPVRLAALQTNATTTLLLESKIDNAPLVPRLQAALAETDIAYELLPVGDCTAALVVERAVATGHELDAVFVAAQAVVAPAPTGAETPEIEITKVEEALAAARGEVARLHDMAEHVAHTHLRQLKIASEVLGWKQERHTVHERAAATNSVAALDGWLRLDRKEVVDTELGVAAPTAVMSELEIADGEEPPVEIKNSVWFEPFEAVTRLYGMPGYTDLDPTPFLAAFFFLFFGLCLTDVGYGLALVVASVFILLFTKVTKSTRSFAKLLLFIGMATVFVGALFGGYLGIDPSLLPTPLQKLQLFDPIGNPLPVFYLALALGVVQVMTGMLLKIYSESRNGRLVDGLLDQGPWLALFGIGILYLFTTLGYVTMLPLDVISKLAIADAVIIFLASGRNGVGVVGKLVSAFAGLYAGVGHFSDILSYSRLLALGLATSALAFAVNLIAGMVSGVPYVGFVFAAVILIIGHLFTLAINTLGAFVHSARLQFVEFFGKFISGTGSEFSPLVRSEKYVSIKDD